MDKRRRLERIETNSGPEVLFRLMRAAFLGDNEAETERLCALVRQSGSTNKARGAMRRTITAGVAFAAEWWRLRTVALEARGKKATAPKRELLAVWRGFEAVCTSAGFDPGRLLGPDLAVDVPRIVKSLELSPDAKAQAEAERFFAFLLSWEIQ